MKTTLYIVRHGESEGNVQGDIFGADPPLTEKGIHQAQALSLIFESKILHHVYASSLKRAHKTAQIIADKKGLPVSLHEGIRERHFGSLEGKTGAYGKEHHGLAYEKFNTVSAVEQMNWKVVPDMESFGEALKRVLKAFDEITHTHKGKTLLLVSHANVMLSLLAHLQFATFNEMPQGTIQNTAYIKIEKNDDVYSITETQGITKK
ncbi:histidine phosphatase family protein [Candidatus Roizmanbacteria bacterium]|nr:histidine phosphatase family protein [Candidatus Roizmanbacteria bacterium]